MKKYEEYGKFDLHVNFAKKLSQRDMFILEKRLNEGKSYKKIAPYCEISPCRIQQIYKHIMYQAKEFERIYKCAAILPRIEVIEEEIYPTESIRKDSALSTWFIRMESWYKEQRNLYDPEKESPKRYKKHYRMTYEEHEQNENAYGDKSIPLWASETYF